MKPFLVVFMLMCLATNAQEQLVSSVDVKEQKEPCLQTITGQIRDQISKEPIPNTIVSLTDTDGNPIQTLMATEDATFTFMVDCQKTYKLTASKDTYNPQSKIFTTNTDSGLELMTKIFLDQGRIDFVYDPAKETKTDDTAKIDTQTKVASTELITPITTVAKPDIEEKEEEKAKVEKTIEQVTEVPKKITKVQEVPKSNEQKENVLVLKPVLFDYESSYLNQQAKKDLIEVVHIMKKNPNLIIECASYTDAKGSEKYNLWMSERRAKRTVDYIVKRGIHPSRITGKGYGKAKLINACTDDCTDEQRAVNRRTEFKVVKK